jgi:hypothetical protein
VTVLLVLLIFCVELLLFFACSAGMVFIVHLCGSTFVVFAFFAKKKKNLAPFTSLGVVTLGSLHG